MARQMTRAELVEAIAQLRASFVAMSEVYAEAHKRNIDQSAEMRVAGKVERAESYMNTALYNAGREDSWKRAAEDTMELLVKAMMTSAK